MLTGMPKCPDTARSISSSPGVLARAMPLRAGNREPYACELQEAVSISGNGCLQAHPTYTAFLSLRR